MIDYATPKDRDFDINQLEGIIEEDKPELFIKARKFNTQWLPSVLQNMVEAVAESYNVPVDLPACVGLGVASSCACGRVSVKIHDEWTERAQLFICSCLQSGSKKSPVMKRMSQFLEKWQIDENKERKIKIAEDQETLSYYEENQIKARKAGKLEEAKEWARKAAAFIPARELHRFAFTGDITPEALTSYMASNGNALSILDDEGQLFGVCKGRYSNDPNIAPLLKGYTGSTIQVYRKGSPPIDIYNACTSILMVVQPEEVDAVVNNDRMTHQGFAARFLLSFPDERCRTKRNAPSIPKETEKRYEQQLKKMISIGKRTFFLSAEAYNVGMTFVEEYEDKLFETEKYTAMDKKRFSGKVNGNLFRIAAILKMWDNTTTDEIDASTMRNACSVMQYFIDHFMHRYGLRGLLSENALKMLKHLSEMQEPIQEREVTQNAKGFGRGTALASASISELVEAGIIERYSPEQRGAGRPMKLLRFLVRVNP